MDIGGDLAVTYFHAERRDELGRDRRCEHHERTVVETQPHGARFDIELGQQKPRSLEPCRACVFGGDNFRTDAGGLFRAEKNECRKCYRRCRRCRNPCGTYETLSAVEHAELHSRFLGEFAQLEMLARNIRAHGDEFRRCGQRFLQTRDFPCVGVAFEVAQHEFGGFGRCHIQMVGLCSFTQVARDAWIRLNAM